MIAIIVAVVLLILVVVAAACGRALILAALHRGRHEQREQAAEAEAKAFIETFDGVDQLRERPAPGKDYISDRNVWLPRTPRAERVTPLRVWEPSRQPTEAELDEWKERWRAAQGGPRLTYPLPAISEDDLYDLCEGCRGHDHCDGAVEICCCTCGWDEDWAEDDDEPDVDVDADVEEWKLILAPAERLATAADQPEDVLPAWIIEALNGHDSTDAAVDSIVARAVTP